MVLEAVIVCIDNSEFMRNSDFSPSRYEAQEDACNLICGTKTRQNLENVVGLITTAGRAVEVQVSLTQDLTKMLSALHRVKLGGEADIVSAIQVARLALRHRQNKRQGQRIVLFVGSPVSETEKDLARLGGQLKKSGVAVDIVSFGEENATENQEKLDAFHKSVNNHDNSHIITIPPGTHMLSELLARTPIVRGEDAETGSSAGGYQARGGGFDYVDENVDPELAMTLKLSLETEEAERKARESTGAKDAKSTADVNSSGANDIEMDDEEFAEALRMSMQSGENLEEAMTEEEEMEMALRLSCQTASSDRERDEKESLLSKDDKEPADMGTVDPNYMSSVFLELPGIDPNDPEVQALLQGMQQDKGDKKDEK